ncbi:hypothetical protein A2U01_0075960, partial [Trifolium medium]|nr:hypothetical protein [Trifolium medium]
YPQWGDATDSTRILE